jgi:hypothetical protein
LGFLAPILSASAHGHIGSITNNPFRITPSGQIGCGREGDDATHLWWYGFVLNDSGCSCQSLFTTAPLIPKSIATYPGSTLPANQIRARKLYH